MLKKTATMLREYLAKRAEENDAYKQPNEVSDAKSTKGVKILSDAARQKKDVTPDDVSFQEKAKKAQQSEGVMDMTIPPTQKEKGISPVSPDQEALHRALVTLKAVPETTTIPEQN